jgi:hypothetical protein
MVGYIVLAVGGIFMFPCVHPDFWIDYFVGLMITLITVCANLPASDQAVVEDGGIGASRQAETAWT